MTELGQKTTILIVDDDESAVEMLNALLKGQGYQTRKAVSGQEALNIIEQEIQYASHWHPWTIDLILLDIMMPGIDGYKICLRIKDDPAIQHTPVIMVTALESSRDKNAAISFGADGYITKPYLSEELMSAIKASLRIKTQQEVLKRRLAELETTSAAAESAQRSLSLSIVVASALTTLVESQHIEAGAIYTLDEATQSLTLNTAQGPQDIALPTISSCDLGKGVVGWIGQSQQGKWIDDMTAYPEFADRPSSPMHAYVGVVLSADDRTVGVLEVFHRQPGWYDQRDVEWLSELGQKLGMAIGNANLFQHTQSLLIQSSSLNR